VFERALFAWRYKDATMKGDSANAGRARADSRAYDETHPPARGNYELVLYALEAGDMAGACEDLWHWLSSVRADGDWAERDSCKQALHCVVDYFAAPGSWEPPRAQDIYDSAFKLAPQAEEYLGAPTVRGLIALRDAHGAEGSHGRQLADPR
jgi:hypothetical protein